MALGMERDYHLRWMDFDQYGRLQPFALLDMCQDVATLQAEEMGIGHDEMLARGVFWVVVRQKFEVIRNPRHFQTVTVRTWPHTPTRFSFQRDFAMRDEQGELLAKMTSEWVLVNEQTRKFATVKDYYAPTDDFDEARAFERKPRKIADFPEGNRPPVTMTPSYPDIDLNGHVNNARYADYVVNALNPDAEGAVKSFQIDYRHEVLPGTPFVMHTLVEDGIVRSQGVREDGTIAFASLIELR